MSKSKVQKKIKKYKNASTTKIILALVIMLIAAFVYIYTNTGDDRHNYSAEQNPDTGYYYYNYAETGTYYYQANDLIGGQLQSQLHEIINNGFIGINYGDVRYILESSDLSSENPTKLWTIYSGDLIEPVWDAGHSWAREHVWPNSRLGTGEESVSNTDQNQATDAHNLRAIVPSVNSTRSNNYYTEGNGEAGLSDAGYYPGNDHRGDVARILFYMATMYDYLTLTNDTDLLDVDETESYEAEGMYMGKLSLLLEWHREDPVSAFEIARNNIIYASQANRNPFIDHPEYVHLIWEGSSISDLIQSEVDPVDTAFNHMRKVTSLLWMSIG